MKEYPILEPQEVKGFTVRYAVCQLLWCDGCDAEIECGDMDDIVAIAEETGWYATGEGEGQEQFLTRRDQPLLEHHHHFAFVGFNADIFEITIFGISAPDTHLHFAGHLFATFREFLLGEVLLQFVHVEEVK